MAAVLLQTDAAETKGFRQLAEQDGAAVNLQAELDRLQQSLSASHKRASWLRRRLVAATQARSNAIQVCCLPVLVIPSCTVATDLIQMPQVCT